LCSFFAQVPLDQYVTDGSDAVPEPVDYSPDLYVKQIPKNIILDFDYTCNFVCPSCRSNLINYNNHHVLAPINDRISQQIKHLIIDQIKDEMVSIRWCGGEPFISRVYSDLLEYIFLKKQTKIKHVIQTNGSYLKKKSDLVTALLPTVKDMRVSFDAATADTYHKIRVNGQWNHLLENVRWLRQCIDQVAPECVLSADFVVQLDNYKEIPAFIDLCRELGIDKINWQKMWNWGTWSQEEFLNKNIYRSNHPQYADLVQVFAQAKQTMSLL
jgi:MoaA/NifB/PqqE/SkfB family radical SAM enzyme